MAGLGRLDEDRAPVVLANPDLPRRLAAGGPYNTPDSATFFGGDERGFTDYPALV